MTNIRLKDKGHSMSFRYFGDNHNMFLSFTELLTKPESFTRGFDFSKSVNDFPGADKASGQDENFSKEDVEQKSHIVDLAQLLKNQRPLDLMESTNVPVTNTNPPPAELTEEEAVAVLETLSKVFSGTSQYDN